MIRALPFLLAAVALCAAGPARATYRLGPGDVVEVSVLGVQDYRRRVTVDVDGAVALPLVGEIPAEGLAVGDLRRRITEGLVAGRALKNPDVTVELVEYRPFYVSGDVARPGAIPYRPGLTARVAVALAGGYDALRFRSENPCSWPPRSGASTRRPGSSCSAGRRGS
ncbi:polysaccharide biosynthesis/export family protein [Methylobacterium persicinum]